MDINKDAKVLVTGATGYVAGWLIKRLLDEGVSVHAAVRDPSDKEKLRYLDKLAADSPGHIRYFKTDLLQKGSYKEAMDGCQIVFHTASPFIMTVKNPQKDLIEPALHGTQNVLEQANATDSVARVVLTSSCAAIYGDSADLDATKEGIFTEEDWNHSSSLTHLPYSYSKVLAEKEAWKIYQNQDRWQLVAVNPGLVLGPGINPYASSESFRLIKQLGDGQMKQGVPNLALGVVDVRDLAEAHVRAAYQTHAKGRYIICGHNTSFLDMAATLIEHYGAQYPIPKKTLPKWLVWSVGPLMNKAMTRKWVVRNVNYPWKADNSKGIKELGMHYRPLPESMNDMFQQLIDSGRLK